jgi:hypothetical protein
MYFYVLGTGYVPSCAENNFLAFLVRTETEKQGRTQKSRVPTRPVRVRPKSLIATSSDCEESSVNGSIESESTTLVEEGSYSDASEESEDQEVVDVVPVTCELCEQAPCDWDTFGEDIWEECNGLKEQGIENKAVFRVHAYKLYSCMQHGILHHFDRRRLPVCVCGEILDCLTPTIHMLDFN